MSRLRSIATTVTTAVVAAAFTVVGHTVAAAEEVGATPNFQLPFPCGTKVRMESFGHAPALDIFRNPTSETEGQQLVAPKGGKVNRSYYAPSGAGNIVQIDHGGGWFTTYIHLQSRAVSVGQYVNQGQPIGRVGHTGETSNSVPHLHYEMAIDRNGDGFAEWGHPNNERVPVRINGEQYGTANGQRTYLTSQNCGSKYWFPDCKTFQYRVTEASYVRSSPGGAEVAAAHTGDIANITERNYKWFSGEFYRVRSDGSKEWYAKGYIVSYKLDYIRCW